jgi:diguanylate cyclase
VRYDPLPPRRQLGWLSGLFRTEQPAEELPELVRQPLPSRDPADDRLPEETKGEDLAALAEQLAELIAAAQRKLDTAAILVDYSADEAGEYGRALEAEASSINKAVLPETVVETLFTLTRTMIDRTKACEERLRATNSELRLLQRDLDQAQIHAERDPLTGLPNRRALEQALRQAVATAKSADAALSVAFCDIDSFKRLNDIHGHAVGDRVLRLVGDCLSDGDDVFVGRQGGEEFVMVFEGVAAIEAAARVDAIRAALAARSLRSRSDGTPIGSVTFSAGVAGLTQTEEAEEVLARADRALYRAKQDGRNQVVIDAGG